MKAKIFYGAARTGKTRTASMICNYFGSDKIIYLNGRDFPAEVCLEALLQQIKQSTRLILIDDVPADFNYMCFATWIPNGGTFLLRAKCEPITKISNTKVNFIFTTNIAPKDTSLSFLNRFELIEFPNPEFDFGFNLSEEENKEIAIKYISQYPLDTLGFTAARKLGHIAIDTNSSEISLSFIDNYKDEEYRMKLSVTAESKTDTENKAYTQYFINTYYLQPKNKLEEQLQEAFINLEHKIINEEDIISLRNRYEYVLRAYKESKGRSYVNYTQNNLHDGNISIMMTDRIKLDLTRIRGNYSKDIS